MDYGPCLQSTHGLESIVAVAVMSVLRNKQPPPISVASNSKQLLLLLTVVGSAGVALLQAAGWVQYGFPCLHLLLTVAT